MKEIWQIFADDTKRLLKNPVAIIVTLGLIIIPSLYAWFNIAANWDPYGNTNNLKIAVANVDAGVTLRDAVPDYDTLPNADKLALDPDKTIMNIGDKFVENLRENDQINWTFVDYEQALDGVESGEYYAAIVVPENFSRDFFSFLQEDIVHPTLEYHVNAKKNAIATKITDTVVTSVKTQVNESFINTVTEIFGTAINDVAVNLDEVSYTTLSGTLENFYLIDEHLSSLEDTLSLVNSSFVAAEALVDTSRNNLPSLQEDLSKLSGDSGDIAALSAAGKNMATAADTALDTIIASLDNAADTLERQWQVTEDAFDEKDRQTLLDDMQDSLEKNLALIAKSEEFVQNWPLMTTHQRERLLARLAKLQGFEQNALDDVRELQSDLKGYGRFTEKNLQKIDSDLQEIKQAAGDLHAYYQSEVAGTLNDNLDNLIDLSMGTPAVIGRLQGMLSSLDGALGGLDALLTNQIKTYDSLQNVLARCRSQVGECIAALERGEQLGEENYLYNLMTNDPQKLASFISSPTNVETITMYPIGNYGSAMAPFYTILSLWVGALVLAAIVNVNITNPAFQGFKLWQQYFGRSITFSLMGIMQALVVALGDLYILHIQCLSPWKFILICVVCSYTFNKIVYTLTIALDDVGKAIAVILLVLQVAGSGGTFPSEVMPRFFSAVNSVLPFSFGLAATRECIAGFYGNTYWLNVLCEFLYVPPCIAIGLLTWKKVYKAKNYFRRKMEETGIM